MKFISKIFSYIFHPLLAPTIGIVIILNTIEHLSAIHPDAKKWLYILVFVTTFLFPAISLLFLLWQKLITNIELNDKKERLLPIIITLTFYYLGYYFLGINNVSGLLRAFYLSAIISISLSFFINIFWKISAHMIGIGGIIGLILVISFKQNLNLELILIIAVLIAGIIGTSRIKLKAHTNLQIIAGFYLGLITVFTTLFIY
jgi:hypothetical protein